MSEKESVDRRVVRTKKALWSALLDLIKERDWDDINVRGICDRADVARSSFYLHFHNKQDLLDFGFSSGRKELSERFDALKEEQALRAFLDWLVDHLAQSGTLFQSRNGQLNPAILQRFKTVVGDLLAHQLRRQAPDLTREQNQFITGGVFAILEDWLCERHRLRPAEVVHIVEAEIERHVSWTASSHRDQGQQ